MIRRTIAPAAQKWLAFAERRRDHLVDLYQSGRWRHYYTEEEFLDRMRDVIEDIDRWSALAPARGEMSQAAE